MKLTLICNSVFLLFCESITKNRLYLMTKITYLILIFFISMITTLKAADVPVYNATLLETYPAFDARQGVAVDKEYFYAVDSYSVTKHRKSDGKAVLQWDGDEYGKVIFHLDSMMERDGKLYASHSNYSITPMTSSVEVWDAETLNHVATHSFGIYRGSFTWLDRHDGFWWGAFANYDRIQKGDTEPYGKTKNTQIVKMDDNFNTLQSWILPDYILSRITPMSNSGGSWGPDGLLYLTGHDHGELYVMQIPEAGSILHHAATVIIPNSIEGQGIAWDRSENGTAEQNRILWGISKQKRNVYKVSIPVINELLPQEKGIIRNKNFNME